MHDHDPIPLTRLPWSGRVVATWVVMLIATGLLLWALIGWAL